MGKLIINEDKLNSEVIKELMSICPFNALEECDGKLSINAGCKMCKLCVKKGPKGAMEFVEDKKKYK